MRNRKLARKINAALAEADPLSTNLPFAELLDEYRWEAKEIASRINRGEPLDKAVFETFEDSTSLALTDLTMMKIRRSLDLDDD